MSHRCWTRASDVTVITVITVSCRAQCRHMDTHTSMHTGTHTHTYTHVQMHIHSYTHARWHEFACFSGAKTWGQTGLPLLSVQISTTPGVSSPSRAYNFVKCSHPVAHAHHSSFSHTLLVAALHPHASKGVHAYSRNKQPGALLTGRMPSIEYAGEVTRFAKQGHAYMHACIVGKTGTYIHAYMHGDYSAI